VTPEFRTGAEKISARMCSVEMQLPPQEIQIECGGAVVDVEIAAASYCVVLG